MAYPACKIIDNASMVKSVNFFFFFLSMANSVGLARTMGKRSEELTYAWMQ